VERFLKSFVFSAACAAVWGSLSALRARDLIRDFSWMEVAWLVYNATISALFLVRTRPALVSMKPLHWLVALLTSFSGLLFTRTVSGGAYVVVVGDALILLGLVGSGTAAVALGRSYDFLPALRGVSTGWLYRYIRHPMYAASIIIRLGYVVKHFSAYNGAVFLIMVWLYDQRAGFEEQVMRNDPHYLEYESRVRFRFVPGLR
jgi:protein-S-isoprenylcysteine O-methyltransferase Ste14